MRLEGNVKSIVNFMQRDILQWESFSSSLQQTHIILGLLRIRQSLEHVQTGWGMYKDTHTHIDTGKEADSN